MDYAISAIHPPFMPNQTELKDSAIECLPSESAIPSMVKVREVQNSKEELFEEEQEKNNNYGEIEGMPVISNDADDLMVGDFSEDEYSMISESTVTSAKQTPEHDDFHLRTEKVVVLIEHNEPSFANVKTSTPIGTKDRRSSTNKMTENDDKDNTTTPRTSVQFGTVQKVDDYSFENLSDFFGVEKSQETVIFDDYVESVEEESELSFVEEKSMLDREPYYEKYEQLGEELTTNRIKNNLLQKLLIMYLKKRKVENCIRETDPPLDQVQKYHQKLKAFEALLQINESQRATISTEVITLKERRNAKEIELIKLVKTMQSKEESTGRGLIYAKTGNEISDKLVEKLIKRQSIQIVQVSSMRLKYIKLKGMVQEKLEAIDRLDLIENNLHLVDYEQLKADNRTHADKIEEREEELTRLRLKCQNTTQILAHMREKSEALETDVTDLIDEYDSIEDISKHLRSNLAYLKHSRDKYRSMVNKLNQESGLLAYPILLMDMEASLNELEQGKLDLDKYKKEVTYKTEIVRNLRKNIERLMEAANRKRINKIILKNKLEDQTYKKKSNPTTQQQIYKGRPSLYMPTINMDAFKDLIDVRPSPTVLNKNKH